MFDKWNHLVALVEAEIDDFFDLLRSYTREFAWKCLTLLLGHFELPPFSKIKTWIRY